MSWVVRRSQGSIICGVPSVPAADTSRAWLRGGSWQPACCSAPLPGTSRAMRPACSVTGLQPPFSTRTVRAYSARTILTSRTINHTPYRAPDSGCPMRVSPGGFPAARQARDSIATTRAPAGLGRAWSNRAKPPVSVQPPGPDYVTLRAP